MLVGYKWKVLWFLKDKLAFPQVSATWEPEEPACSGVAANPQFTFPGNQARWGRRHQGQELGVRIRRPGLEPQLCCTPGPGSWQDPLGSSAVLSCFIMDPHCKQPDRSNYILHLPPPWLLLIFMMLFAQWSKISLRKKKRFLKTFLFPALTYEFSQGRKYFSWASLPSPGLPTSICGHTRRPLDWQPVVQIPKNAPTFPQPSDEGLERVARFCKLNYWITKWNLNFKYTMDHFLLP